MFTPSSNFIKGYCRRRPSNIPSFPLPTKKRRVDKFIVPQKVELMSSQVKSSCSSASATPVWQCQHCTLENLSSQSSCNACGLPSPQNSNEDKKQDQDIKLEHLHLPPVCAVILASNGSLIALNKDKQTVWKLGGVSRVEKFSSNELLVLVKDEAVVIDKDTAQASMHLTGDIQQVVMF